MYARPSLYTQDPDEYRRFLLLTHAAFLCCQRMGFAPQILHCNDWHTAMAPLWLRSIYRWDALFARTRSVMTIHNIGYQGVVGAVAARRSCSRAPASSCCTRKNCAPGASTCCATALLYADLLTTVSPTYAREIQTAEYGMGLEDTLRARSDSLLGILNGVDYEEWDPRVDRYLPRHFGADQLGVKAGLKQEFLARLRPGGRRAPAADRHGQPPGNAEGFRPADRGTAQAAGSARFQPRRAGHRRAAIRSDFFTQLERGIRGRVHFQRGYSDELAHWIEAASDMFLMPSRYEPCGLNQMYSLRYGTVPIVRRTGGLADSVQHFDVATGTGYRHRVQRLQRKSPSAGRSATRSISTSRRAPGDAWCRTAWRRISPGTARCSATSKPMSGSPSPEPR